MSLSLLPKSPSVRASLEEWEAHRQALIDFPGDEPLREPMIHRADSYIAVIRAEQAAPPVV